MGTALLLLRGSLVVKSLGYKTVGRGFENLRVNSASNRNEYQSGSKGRPARKIGLLRDWDPRYPKKL
jgi:hypothetical protein